MVDYKDVNEFNKDIQKHLSSSEEFCRPYHDVFKRLNDLYHVKLPSEFSEPPLGRSNIIPPEFHNSVRNAVTRMKREIFSLQPLVQIEVEKDIVKDSGQLAQMVLDYNFKKNNFNQKFGRMIYKSLMQTVGIGWLEFIERKDVKLVKDNKTGKHTFKEGNNILFKGFDLKVLDAFQIYPDSYCPYIDDQYEYSGRYFGIKIMTTISQLKSINLYDQDKVDQITPQKARLENFQKPYFPHIMLSQINANEHHDFPIEITHFVERGRIRTFANREIKLRDMELALPDYPLILMYLENEDFSFFGMSPAKLSEDMFYELYQKRNQRIDNINIALTDVYITDDDTMPDVITPFPGKVIKVRGGADSLVPLQKQNITDRSFQEELVSKQDIRDTFGSNDYSMGMNPTRGGESATGVMVMDRRSVAATVDMVLNVEESGLKKIAQKGLMLCEIFYTTKDKQMIVGDKIEKFVHLDSTSIFTNFVYTCKGSDRLENQVAAKSNALQMFALFQQDPYIDPYELRKDVFEAFEKKNIDKLLPLPEYKFIPIKKENYLLAQGVDIPVDQSEDDMMHLQTHKELIPILNQLKDPKPALVHIRQHQISAEQKYSANNVHMSFTQMPKGAGNESGLAGYNSQQLTAPSVPGEVRR